jgi:hypothetical protein
VNLPNNKRPAQRFFPPKRDPEQFALVSSEAVCEASYDKLPLDELLVHAVKRISDAGEDCTFERLVYECFSLFPRKFGFERYPQWPDSARVNKTWLRCRTDKGWIVGTVQEGFRLTPKGERASEAAAKKLLQETVPSPKRTPRPRERYEAALHQMHQSEVFRRFTADPVAFSLSEMELRNLLGCTLETPRRVLGQNLHYYLDAARQYGDQAVLGFIETCRAKWPALFPKKPRG